MNFSFNNKKFKKDVLYELFTISSLGILIYLYSIWQDILDIIISPLSILFLMSIIGYLVIYPTLVMFNYRKFNKDSIISIDDDRIVYKRLEKEEIIKNEDIDTIYLVKGHGSGLLPYYYEIKLKDGRKFYISYFLIKDLEEYVDKTVYWRRGSLFIPEE